MSCAQRCEAKRSSGEGGGVKAAVLGEPGYKEGKRGTRSDYVSWKRPNSHHPRPVREKEADGG